MKLRYSILAVLLVLFVGVYPSEKFELYTKIHYFDKYMHLLGGFAIAWLLWHFFNRDLTKVSRLGFIMFLFSGATLIGVFWEFAEYLSGTYLQHATSPFEHVFYMYFHGGDLKDTLGDLLADMGGALAFTIGTAHWHTLNSRQRLNAEQSETSL